MPSTVLRTAIGYIALVILACHLTVLITKSSAAQTSNFNEPCRARLRRHVKKEDIQKQAKKSETSKKVKVERILLKKAVQSGAVCLDGSPPGYHFKRGWRL